MLQLIKQIVGIYTAPKTQISRLENFEIWLKTKLIKSHIFRFHGFKVATPSSKLLNSAIWEIFISLDYYFYSDNKSPVIIDAGANIGVATLFFKKLFPLSKIICFEPDPDAFRFLEKNVYENKLSDVSLNCMALSAIPGDLSFFRLKNTISSMGSLIRDDIHSEEIKVKTAKLSDFIEREIDFLKLDVENQELAVIQELKESDKLKFIKQLVIDWHCKDINPATLLKILEDAGFKIQISSSCRRPFNIRNHVNLLIYACKL